MFIIIFIFLFFLLFVHYQYCWSVCNTVRLKYKFRLRLLQSFPDASPIYFSSNSKKYTTFDNRQSQNFVKHQRKLQSILITVLRNCIKMYGFLDQIIFKYYFNFWEVCKCINNFDWLYKY